MVKIVKNPGNGRLNNLNNLKNLNNLNDPVLSVYSYACNASFNTNLLAFCGTDWPIGLYRHHQ